MNPAVAITMRSRILMVAKMLLNIVVTSMASRDMRNMKTVMARAGRSRYGLKGGPMLGQGTLSVIKGVIVLLVKALRYWLQVIEVAEIEASEPVNSIQPVT